MDEASETVVIEVNQVLNATNHNGGRVLFGPDGYLYLSIGDGGGGGDPQETGQNLESLPGEGLAAERHGAEPLHRYLRTTRSSGRRLDEIWAYGLRNPWRYSFDRATGALWLGDVGQGSQEEVDVIEGGGNYGWDCFEGSAEFEQDCAANCCQLPRAVYQPRRAIHARLPAATSTAVGAPGPRRALYLRRLLFRQDLGGRRRQPIADARVLF